jgi:putative tryptophan/tyrosine transport system substrate-binding protein
LRESRTKVMKVAMVRSTIRRKGFALALLALFVAAGSLPAAEEARRVIVLRSISPPDNYSTVLAGILEGLARYGWKPGKNIVVTDILRVEGAWKDFPFADSENIDLAFSLSPGGVAAIEPSLAARDKPLVFALGDLAAEGIVGPLDRPSGTNMLAVYYEAGARSLLPLAEFLPEPRTLGIVVSPESPGDLLLYADFIAKNQKPSVRLVKIAAADADGGDAATALAGSAVSVLVGGTDGYDRMTAGSRGPSLPAISVRVAVDRRIASTDEILGIDYQGQSLGRLMGDAGGRLLAGGLKASTAMPIKAGGRIFVNLAAMKRLGITLPSAIIAQAGIVVR